MLIYSKQLKDKVDAIIKGLILGDKMVYWGSFGKKYVTDIDVTNFVHNRSVDDVINHITTIAQPTAERRFIRLTAGSDPRYTYDWDKYDKASFQKLTQELHKLKLLSDEDIELINRSQDDIYLYQFLFNKKSVLRWSFNELMNREKIIDSITIKLVDAVEHRNVIHLIHKIDDIYIGIDIHFDVIKTEKIVQPSIEQHIMMANYKIDTKDYYFALRELRHFFKNDRNMYKQLQYITEEKYGKHKQLLTYIYLFKNITNNSVFSDNPDVYYTIFKKIVKYNKRYINFSSPILNIIYNGLKTHSYKETTDAINKLADEYTTFLNNIAYKDLVIYRQKLSDNIKQNIHPLD
ncbi:MAG: hypothetical protein Faunusvirus22_2 [Faunusvirus sp.]|jgi:hypothetical protein|uniref:L544-like helical domain-containing protein n=1 Tax=Faunusvirus sp. TaxID=2487766 RepID=A0A3G4ZZW1_9VIRU|nr:MAG: hypothetical protein Faunusvirus22_2 [Faunusvirus sp.]